jgi:probable LLM family oxidoreductase
MKTDKLNSFSTEDAAKVEFGLDTPGYVTVDRSCALVPHDLVIRNTVEEAVLAEAVGIDSFNVAEHYQSDLLDSAGEVILAAIAGRTRRIRLGTAVTVLSTQDPVRVYANFATLDAVSDGRAQLIVGRGSAVESFPLFGFELADYDALFEDKLDLFMQLMDDQPVTWSGTGRPPLVDQSVGPSLPAGHLPTWVGVGGTPTSAVRAARYGLPLMVAAIGGAPSRFGGIIELYRRTLERLGTPRRPVGMHSPGFVAARDDEAIETQWPHHEEILRRASVERGWRVPTYDQYLHEITDGSLYIGSVETVARKIAKTVREHHLDRFDLAYGTGRVPHEDRMTAISLFGREVIPRVRELLAAVDLAPRQEFSGT